MRTYLRLPLFIIVTAAIAACSEDAPVTEAEPVLRPVKTLSVVSTQAQSEQQLPGTVDALRNAELAFRVSGVVNKLLVKEGDPVEKGQLIAQLDTTDYQIQHDSNAANFETAESQFKRGETLVEEGHISTADFETLKANYNTAKAALAASDQSLKYTNLTAPFNGVVAQQHVERFEEINAKQAIISIQDLSKLVVSIDVPESVMITIERSRQGDDSLYTTYATFDAIDAEQFPLTFKEASTQADEATNTFKVDLTMENPDAYSILPGMSATVHGRRNVDDDAPSLVYLPSHSVMEDADGRFVFIAKPDGENEAVVNRVNVAVGSLTEQGIVIESGLSNGDKVVVAGMSKMRDGLRVRLDTAR
ncbi:MAG: efflux RND transporter periplasmic adaptor subunit [Pseudomonadota bacterium]